MIKSGLLHASGVEVTGKKERGPHLLEKTQDW